MSAPQDIATELCRRLAGEADILAALLFGSRAPEGRPRRDSDIDLALLVAPRLDARATRLEEGRYGRP